MKAVICERYGPPEVLKLAEVEKPVPKSGEILIKIVATAVNSGDVRVRGLVVDGFLRVVMRVVLGFNGPRKKILGIVLSGVVEAVGDTVTDFNVGDEVYAQTGFKFGTYAEYITLNEKACVARKPTKATFEEAAALLFGGTTSLYFLGKVGLESLSGRNVLIYGASGAVGTAAVQIAKYYGAHVTGVCSSGNVALVQSLGADRVIPYDTEDFTQESVKYDVIFDAVGKKSRKECENSLATDGRYVTVGGLDTASERKEQLELLSRFFDEGKYKAVIDKVFSLDQIVEAHRYVDQGRKKGNVVVRL